MFTPQATTFSMFRVILVGFQGLAIRENRYFGPQINASHRAFPCCRGENIPDHATGFLLPGRVNSQK